MFLFVRPIRLLAARPLLPDSTLVEGQLLTLEDVAVGTTALAGSRRDNGIETTSLELPLQSGFNLAVVSKTLGLLLLHTLALLVLANVDFLARLLLPPTTQALTVMCLVPLPERRRVDLDHRALGQSICAHELIIGRMEGDADDTSLA
jgi:hypothetical protein